MEYLSEEVRAELLAAARAKARRRSRLRVQAGDAIYPILRLWDTGFTLDAGTTPALRGLVDVYDGSRHLMQCLIVASEPEAGELVCDFKWSRPVADTPPVDFARDDAAPVGYLTHG